MNIRTKITGLFFIIVIIVLSTICGSIYFFSSNYRRVDFYNKLKNRAVNTAILFIEVDEVDAELLKRIEKNDPASLPNQYIAIYNSANNEIFNSNGNHLVPAEADFLDRLENDDEIQFRYRDYEVVCFNYANKRGAYRVIAAATDVNGNAALTNLRNILLATFCVNSIIVLILGWVYSGRVLKPILKIVNDVSKITAANLDQRLGEGNGRDELSRLAQTFNDMLRRLQGAFSSQKAFIANASHEIKTPLTVMSAEIDVTLLQPREKEYYIMVLRSVHSGLKNLNKLSTQLLQLAQASSDIPNVDFSTFRIDDVLWEVKEELEKAQSNYEIEISLDMGIIHESLLVNGDQQLIKVALMNLVDNGCKYSDDQKVAVDVSADHKRILLLFVNSGKGIDKESITKIFDPFYRGRESGKGRGFGIGLSLVSKIITLHHGTIKVESEPDVSTRFTVTLPCAAN
jgi:signal transduction histidine kinase